MINGYARLRISSYLIFAWWLFISPRATPHSPVVTGPFRSKAACERIMTQVRGLIDAPTMRCLHDGERESLL